MGQTLPIKLYGSNKNGDCVTLAAKITREVPQATIFTIHVNDLQVIISRGIYFYIQLTLQMSSLMTLETINVLT